MPGVKCYALTCKNTRCKRFTYFTTLNYGLSVPVCWAHSDRNIIYEWSTSRDADDMPQLIRKFLKMYTSLTSLEPSWDVWFCAYAVSELVNESYFIGDPNHFLQRFMKKVLEPIQEPQEPCPVCYEDDVPLFRTRCGHTFCIPCITNWVKKNLACPMCRKFISHPTITSDEV